MKKGKKLKFNLDFTETALNFNNKKIQELNFWREIFYTLKLMGKKLDGIGYGNLSQGVDYLNTKSGKRQFIITGKDSSALEKLTIKNFTKVLEYDFHKNFVKAEGLVKPSSESLTHGAIYDFDNSLKSIIHVHSQHIWKSAKQLNIPITLENAKKGTTELAFDIQRVLEYTHASDIGIIVLGGHKEGIISFGKTPKEAGGIILKYLVASLEKIYGYNPVSKF
ncbi:MAG: class II aldolase/adducin family protein [Candidatus Hodarchaeota archaeon]